MHQLTHLLGMRRPDLVRALAAAVPGIPADEDAITHAEQLWARGGRPHAMERLMTLDPAQYARSRNHVAGAVSRLSPWLRHGVLSLAEVRDAALRMVSRPEEAAKFVTELGWRDYWRRVHATLGDRIGEPIERPAHPSSRGPVEAMPADVLGAATGMACIDAFVRRLLETGWLHNHERMWLASWLVHVRGVSWRTGADWMLGHLLDGDPASNHLSWQWVAGTFSAKPYLFNRENLESFTDGIHCHPCGLRGICDVEGSYEELAARHLTPQSPPPRPPLRIPPAAQWPPWTGGWPAAPLVWLTLDSVSSAGPAAAAFPEAPRLFVVDPKWLAEERPSLSRLLFLFECLADVPRVEVFLGSPIAVVADRLREHRCDGVAVAETPCPRVRDAAARIRAACVAEAREGGSAAESRVCVLRWPDFCDARKVRDLGRFSRYWQQVGPSALATTGSTAGSRTASTPAPDAGRRG